MVMSARSNFINSFFYEIVLQYYTVAQFNILSSISYTTSAVGHILLCHNKAVLASNAKKRIGF